MKTLLARRTFSAAIVAALILTAKVTVAQQPAQRFIGLWDGAVVGLVLESRSDGVLTGQAEETWIDSAGQKQSGTASISVIAHGGNTDLFLKPRSLITLPFILRGIEGTDHATLRQIEIGVGGHAGILRPGDDVAYQRLLGDLKPAKAAPLIPMGTAPVLAEIETAGLDGGGCQCDAGKTTHIALDTASFAENAAHLLAELNDYARGIEATRIALAGDQQRTSLPLYDIDHAPMQAGWQSYTARVLAGRHSLDAFNRVLEDASRQIGIGLDAAGQRCGQRELTPDQAVTPESNLWRKTCLSIAQARDLYQRQQITPLGDIVAEQADIPQNQ